MLFMIYWVIKQSPGKFTAFGTFSLFTDSIHSLIQRNLCKNKCLFFLNSRTCHNIEAYQGRWAVDFVPPICSAFMYILYAINFIGGGWGTVHPEA